jgi:cytoskeleton protein RodZ
MTEPAPSRAREEAPGPGPQLAQAREALGLSREEVARQLKLAVQQVEALEAGHYHRLPGAVFVRGFIRNYARLVGRDPDELVRAAGETLPAPVARPELPPSQDIPFPTARAKRWPRYALAALLVAAVSAALELYWLGPERKEEGAQAPAVPAAEPVASAAPAARSPAPEPVEARAVETTMTASTAETLNDAPPAPPLPREASVELAFEDDSWVEIRDREGAVIFSRLNRAGTRQRVSGAPPLSLVIGNAHGVKLRYEGEAVDLAAHMRADVARLRLE